MLTPTLARRIAELEEIFGELPPGVAPRLARVVRGWREEDYAAGQRGAAQSQQMPAIKPPK